MVERAVIGLGVSGIGARASAFASARVPMPSGSRFSWCLMHLTVPISKWWRRGPEGGGTMHLPLHCGDMPAVDASGRNYPLFAMPVAQVASRRVTQLQGTSVMKTPYPPQGAPNRGGKLQPPENSGRCDRPTIPNRVSPNLHSPPHDLRRRISSLPWASHRRDGGASPYGDGGPLASRIEPA